MDLEILSGALDVRENPGLETTDPRLSEIATLVQEGNFQQAALQSREILDEQNYDIRIIGYYLYGHFVGAGVEAIGEIMTCLGGLLQNNIEALGPVKNREKQIKNTLSWLFKTLSNNLVYETERSTAAYQQWQAFMTREKVAQILDVIDQLRQTIAALAEASAITDALTKVREWFQVFLQVLPDERMSDEETPEDLEEETSGEQETEQKRRQEKREDRKEEGIGGIEASYPMRLLIQKIDAFDRLIHLDKLALAAIVADDINQIVNHFDPKVYFPAVFAKFYLQFAKNVNSLVNYEQFKSSAAWMALSELYKVDLESFIDFDAMDLDFSGDNPYSPRQGEDEL